MHYLALTIYQLGGLEGPNLPSCKVLLLTPSCPWLQTWGMASCSALCAGRAPSGSHQNSSALCPNLPAPHLGFPTWGTPHTHTLCSASCPKQEKAPRFYGRWLRDPFRSPFIFPPARGEGPAAVLGSSATSSSHTQPTCPTGEMYARATARAQLPGKGSACYAAEADFGFGQCGGIEIAAPT